MNQMMVTLLISYVTWIEQDGQCSHVAHETNLALVERCSLDCLPASEEGEGDGDTASASETDNSDTEESIESSDGSKVDTSQGHLDSGVEEKGVQGHFESLGYFAPDGVSGNTAISGEAGTSVLSLSF